MFTLIVRQSLKDGTAKSWKLRPGNSTHTFGSSRLADVISIAPKTEGIQGLFEFRDNRWWYINMNMSSAQGAAMPAVCLDKEQTIELTDCTLTLTPIEKEANLYLRLEKAGQEQRDAGKQFQLFIVRQGGKVVETKVLPLNKKFKPSMAVTPLVIASTPTQEWKKETVGDLEISQRTVSLEDAARWGYITADQLVDEESKRGVLLVLGAALFLLTVGIFAPKKEMEVVAAPPKAAQKIIVKTEIKQKRKKSETTTPTKVVVKENPSAAGPKNEMPNGGGGGSRVANMMKSLQGGRVSQLIGKVSAQAAKSNNVIFANGTKAGTGASGRALAAVGNIERSGRNWGTEGNGSGVTISTAGRGGGKNASGMGGLAAGGTGSGGVGLIEEEGEITGGLDREVIAQYIKSKLGQILYCYERQLSANPDLFGKVAVKFTIGPTGQVEQQLIGDTTLKNATVEGCILNRVAAWKFPNPQGGTRVLVTYPFLFKSTN
ncbi:AgmX/PglI C-terminal domain-containing protein [Bdellovibrio reynosensis]|uniref:AgmX/PglI C-terminal domain-containing protein n=1 Tax=Bdellovibrio reynosensis TaxID=2835041 RepID=A0ABY4CBZ9_9BACT|nr:AgmX/PglI C-terminal domain-containing protein [Bdellovibrio reynosensis]UOF02430.1 AgmX/PglI C-terminal domain-containing protein [Bdellovibrio reynosensis]